MSQVETLSIDEVLDIPTLTARAAARWGERTALSFAEKLSSPGSRRLSFNTVEARSNQIANALIADGLQPGERVGLMLRNRPEFPLSWLGIVKAGGVMVPLNVFYKTADAGYLLEHAGVTRVVCEQDLRPVVTEAAPGLDQKKEIITVGAEGTFENFLDDISCATPSVTITPESLANIQYTSGTTGRPKGCMLSHSFFLRFGWRVAIAHEGLSDSDVMLTAQPFYYVDPQWNCITSLLVGAELVVLDRFHPSTFWAQVREHKVTWFYCLGVMPKLMLKTPPQSTDRDHQVLRVTCSGIPLLDHREIEQRWGVPWYETFGMTETGLDISVSVEEHDELVGTGCIGRAFVTREARIVTPDDRPAPRGEPGELVLRGPGMLDGYYRNEDATAETFRNGWMHTGDIARMDQDGRIYYVGRLKDMIRRSGENIAAAEVEEVVTQHEAVRLAACVAVPDDVRGEEVKAYIVLQPGHSRESVSPQALSEFCDERLAYFKVPRFWTFTDDLPRTPSEKIIKSEIIADADDLRIGAYDRVDDCWR